MSSAHQPEILVPVNDMNPMAIADSGTSHVILPQSALFDPNLPSQSILGLRRRYSGNRGTSGDLCRTCHYSSMPFRTSYSEMAAYSDLDTSDLNLNCVNKSGTAQGLMQCRTRGDTPYFTAVQFWMLRSSSVKVRSIFLLSFGNSCTWQLSPKAQT